MKLSSEMLAEITEAVTIVGRDEPRPADRRSPRVRLSSHLTAFRWDDPTRPLGIRVHNLSEGGVGILHQQRIPLDEKIVVCFPREDGGQLMLLGGVVFWEPLSQDLYAIGIQFEKIVDQTDLIDQIGASPGEPIGIFSRLTDAFTRALRAAS